MLSFISGQADPQIINRAVEKGYDVVNPWGEWIPTVQRKNYQVYPPIAHMLKSGGQNDRIRNTTGSETACQHI